jgi:hypothetical protein
MNVPTGKWRISPGIQHMDESGNWLPVLAAAKDCPVFIREKADIRENPFGRLIDVIRKGVIIKIDSLIAAVVQLDPIGEIPVFVGNDRVIPVSAFVDHRLGIVTLTKQDHQKGGKQNLPIIHISWIKQVNVRIKGLIYPLK